MKYPSYLNLSLKEFSSRIKKALGLLGKCQVCPRKCRVNRLKDETGFCGVGRKALVSSFHPHFGEESVLVGSGGSGTIFFAGCNLACVYCQNYDISQLRQGSEVSKEELSSMMISLQKLDCHNINFVSPSHVVPQILESLPLAINQGLKLPLVYNTNAYDSIEILKLLDGIIDIYMPDTKYADDKVAEKYSSAPNYFEVMKKSIKEMYHQVSTLKLKMKNLSRVKSRDEKLKIVKKGVEGIAYHGLLVRHLVLPNNLAGTEKITEFLAREISKNTFINIMDQYRPCYQAFQYPEISRSITEEEYNQARAIAQKVGLKRIYPFF